MHNRTPVHLLCNRIKGNRIIDDPEQFAAELAEKVIPLLHARSCNVGRRGRSAAVRRVLEEWTSLALTYRQHSKRFELQRWEDDGGRVV
jgi:hypothetical protein